MIRSTFFSLIIVSFCVLLFSGCQTKPKSDSNQLTQMLIFQPTHDLGTITQGETVLHTFIIQNTGKHDLIVSKVETQCGCTTVELPKEPIPPGKKGKIEVAFNSSGRYGKQYKEILIFANIPKKSKSLIIIASIK